MTMRSVPSTTSRLSGEASTSIGKHLAGRRFAYRSNSLRMARSPRSGRCSCGTSSHLGPPTAPKRIAWAARQSSRVPGASGLPVASIAAPPTSPRSNSNAVPVPLPTASSTRMASGVTSAPMPSPGRTAIRYVAITWPPRFSAAPRLRADFLHALGRRPSDPVQGAEVRARARLDDVRRGALARDHRAVEVDLHRDLADRVLARRGGPQRVVLEPALEAGDGVDRRQHRIDRPVADARVLERLAFLLQAHRRRRHDPGATDDVEIVEHVERLPLCGLVGDDRHQVLVVGFLLAIAVVGCECTPVMCESRRDVLKISAVRTRVSISKKSFRVRSAITISSSDALPARSPIPLMVHSTCRAPCMSAVSEFATACPRSLWQWTETTTLSMPCTVSRIRAMRSPHSRGLASPTL